MEFGEIISLVILILILWVLPYFFASDGNNEDPPDYIT